MNWKVDFDLSQIQQLTEYIHKLGAADKSVLPNTSQAFYNSAEYAASVWGDYLFNGGSLNGAEPLEKPLKPNQVRLNVESLGDFESKVGTNSERVSEIQEGTNPVFFDMKQTHPYGKKSRVSKKGVPYLIIPFRWATPNENDTDRAHSFFSGTIPTVEYKTNVSGLSITEKLASTHFEKNAQGERIERPEYNWGTRLKKAWNDRALGMVRMKDGTKSTYFTFRIISAKSPAGSWLYWKDGKNAVDMMGALARTVKPGIENIIESGIKKDLGLE